MTSADQILATFATMEMQLQGFAKSSYENELRIAELERQLQDHSAQAFSIGETYANALSRIAELEAQIAAASAPVVEPQPIGYTCQYDLDCLANYNNVTIFPEFDKDISPIALYTAPQTADTDKLRDAILALRVDPPRHYDNAQISAFCLGAKVMSEAAADLAASTAVQAPVREVPEGWISVNDRLPAIGSQVIAYRPTAESTHDDAVMLTRYSGVERISWQGISHGFECICHPSHWMPLPVAPVQQEG